MSVRDNVLVGAYFGRARRGDAVGQAEGALAFTGLVGLGATPASSLTTGQRKLLEIARALATNPELVLLDEVCGGLNAEETAHVLDLIRELPERGVTVIYIEHNMRAVMSVCDRIAVLNFGRKIAEGPPQAIAEDPEVIRAYLGAPSAPIPSLLAVRERPDSSGLRTPQSGGEGQGEGGV